MKRGTIQTLLAAALLVTASASMAQSTPPTSRGDEPMMSHTRHPMQSAVHEHAMKGEHNMPGTVTRVDHKTGIVVLNSLGMRLRVHFPPPTIRRLKAGDKILLHLGYRMQR